MSFTRLSRLFLSAPFVAGLMLGGLSLPANAHADAPVWSQKFDPARDPAADLQAALAQAKAQGKRVLIDVGGDWCVWCKLLDATFEKEVDLAALRDAGFVTLKVHYDSKQNQNAAFLSHYPKVAGYPHLFVLDASGALLHSQDTGALELPADRGKGHDVAKIRAFLTEWGGKAG